MKLQMALHSKEGGSHRFYALNDKISREASLAHASAQCRSNKVPTLPTQDGASLIEAVGIVRRRQSERAHSAPLQQPL